MTKTEILPERKLRPDYTIRSNGEQATGVIAQEVALIHPEMVHLQDSGMLGVDGPSPWRVVAAIQDVQGEVIELRTANDNLKQEVAELRRKVN